MTSQCFCVLEGAIDQPYIFAISHSAKSETNFRERITPALLNSSMAVDSFSSDSAIALKLGLLYGSFISVISHNAPYDLPEIAKLLRVRVYAVCWMIHRCLCLTILLP